MECYSGEDLLKTFQTLDIDLGNTDSEVIKAWFDSDSPDTQEFLSWLCQLGRENVVSVSEAEQYDRLVKKNKALEGEQYESALEDVKRTYPGILDVEEQTIEVEFMREEVAALLNEEKEQEKMITAQEHLNEKLRKSLASASNEHIALNITKREAEEGCLLLSQQLDDTNTELHLQLIKCSEKLMEYENTTEPAYISLASMDVYNDHYDNILSDINLLLKKECNVLPKLETAKKSCRKLNKTIFDFDNINSYLSSLKHRMFLSIQNKNYKEVTEQRLLAELKYLKNLKLFDVINNTMDISFRLQVESSISLKNLHIDRQCLELEDATKQASEGLCNSLKLHFAQNETQIALLKFRNLSSVCANMSKILSYQLLVYLMHVSNHRDLSDAEKFFSTVYHYVTNDLRECVLRTEAMQDKINNYDDVKNFMLHEKHSLGKAFLKILSEYQDEGSDQPVYRLINKFKSERRNLEVKLFCDDFEKFRENSKQFEDDVKLLKTFLASGPTSESVVMPYKLYKSLEDARSTVRASKASVSSTMKTSNDSFKKVTENKWLKMKRQLWVYFLSEPRKVLSCVAEVKAEVNEGRAQAL